MTIMMTILFVRLLMIPLTYQQVVSAQKIAIFKEKDAVIDKSEISPEKRDRVRAELRSLASVRTPSNSESICRQCQRFPSWRL